MSETTTQEHTYSKPATCPRCSGKGSGTWRREFGICFRCRGAGIIETDRAVLAGETEFIAQALTLANAARAHSWEAATGRALLEKNDPARYRRAVESLAAGRADVLDALAAYFASLA